MAAESSAAQNAGREREGKEGVKAERGPGGQQWWVARRQVIRFTSLDQNRGGGLRWAALSFALLSLCCAVLCHVVQSSCSKLHRQAPQRQAKLAKRRSCACVAVCLCVFWLLLGAPPLRIR